MTVPFVCVFLAAVLIYVPRVFTLMGQRARPEGWDNNNPRAQQALLTDWAGRARDAHANAFESFAPFAAAVIVAHLSHADAGWSKWLAVTHVVARTAYPIIYVANLASLRSFVWFIGISATFGLFVLALLA
jgi:uncharacterized MAPEG superfamily protein